MKCDLKKQQITQSFAIVDGIGTADYKNFDITQINSFSFRITEALAIFVKKII